MRPNADGRIWGGWTKAEVRLDHETEWRKSPDLSKSAEICQNLSESVRILGLITTAN